MRSANRNSENIDTLYGLVKKYIDISIEKSADKKKFDKEFKEKLSTGFREGMIESLGYDPQLNDLSIDEYCYDEVLDSATIEAVGTRPYDEIARLMTDDLDLIVNDPNNLALTAKGRIDTAAVVMNILFIVREKGFTRGLKDVQQILNSTFKKNVIDIDELYMTARDDLTARIMDKITEFLWSDR